MFFGFLGAFSSKAVKPRGNFFQIKQRVFKNNICLTYVFKKKQGVLCIDRLLQKTTVKITNRKRNSLLAETAI